MTKIVEYDAYNGMTETFVKDNMTGEIKINKSQDVSGLFANNLEQRNKSRGWQGDWHKVASIPEVVVIAWREELKAKGYNNPDPLAKENNVWLMAKLNSKDFIKLRTKEGVI
jgi:hypothetical protein